MKKIAIHKTKTGFDDRWEAYCIEKGIPFKIVNCYDNDIVAQLSDCQALMWHFHQLSPKDILMAKPLLFSLQQACKRVFPDFATMWHFDDKVGQKYLLEALGVPFVNTYVFYDKQAALEWSKTTTYPKVFKLRGGAGSANVKLIRNHPECVRIVHRIFSWGISSYNAWENLTERYYHYKRGKGGIWDLTKGILRYFKKPDYATINGPEKGYAYFQDFIPNNTYDIRVVVIGSKAFAIKRNVRANDFRASGSGSIEYDKKYFDDATIQLSFEIAQKLQSQCIAFDFVYNIDGQPLVLEISYGFAKHGYDRCEGYWDDKLNWYEGKFNPYGWMVENLLHEK